MIRTAIRFISGLIIAANEKRFLAKFGPTRFDRIQIEYFISLRNYDANRSGYTTLDSGRLCEYFFYILMLTTNKFNSKKSKIKHESVLKKFAKSKIKMTRNWAFFSCSYSPLASSSRSTDRFSHPFSPGPVKSFGLFFDFSFELFCTRPCSRSDFARPSISFSEPARTFAVFAFW